eukprot:31831-Eustigmatos_ZCMA.PRE.1
MDICCCFGPSYWDNSTQVDLLASRCSIWQRANVLRTFRPHRSDRSRFLGRLHVTFYLPDDVPVRRCETMKWPVH